MRRKSKNVKACIAIEKELSKLKLRANMIPEQSYGVNLRGTLSRSEWDIIRSLIYKRDGYKCTICNQEGAQLHAHEDWIFDYKKGIQVLGNIISVCVNCHNNIHLGHSSTFKESIRKELKHHWCKINNKNEEDFKKYIFNLMILERCKDQFKWKVVDNNGIEITHNANLQGLLNSLDLMVDAATEDLRQIYNISSNNIEKLRDCGINTRKQLIEHENLAELASMSKISLLTLNKYRLNAESMVKKEIYQIAPFTIPDGRIIYLDIETEFLNNEKIWLIGFEIDGKYAQLYADTWEQEEDILLKFVEVLKDNPKVPLLIFSGTNSDFRIMKKAMERLGMDVIELTSHPYLDLCTLIRRSFIVPGQSFRLKDLGELFKYPFKHTHLNGFDAAYNYGIHIETGKPLEQEILEYAEDDVKVLPFLIEAIRKGEGIIKKNIPGLPSLNSPMELKGDLNELIIKIRDFYDEHGKLSIRKDKRDNSFKTEIRFYAKKLKELDFIRNGMFTLSFREGLPYQYPSKTSCYVPYYGKDQVIRFIQKIKPRKNNDISKLTA